MHLATLLLLLGAMRASAHQLDGCPLEANAASREEAQLLLKTAQAALEAGRFEEAEQSLHGAARLDPASPFVHYALGAALMELRPSEAVQAFKRCRETLRCLREGDSSARERLRGEIDTQIQALRGALLELERDRLKKFEIPGQEMNSNAKPTLGQSVPVVAALEQKISDLQRLRQHPEQEPPNLGVALGRAQFNLGALEEAEREFVSALAKDPGHGDAHNNLAVVLMLQGRLEEARRELKAAEKAGVEVAPRLKQELEARRKAAARR
ncbi:MAG TPA: tetratricopeptide repeat protein [Vicinamibacteria bacterium]